MDILHSLETRWFFQVDSAIAADLEEWFKNEPLENDGDRVDLYYVDPERPDLNAKARGGAKPKLEYKYRVGALGSMSFSANVTGNVERWNKLSLSAEAGLANEPRIIAVSKQRRQRKFAFQDGNVARVDVKARPDAGCGFELTTIKASRGSEVVTSCTLGFEAFGPPPVSIEALTAALRLALAERPRIRLLGSESENYSTWLIRHFATWTHRIVENTPYYDNPAQGRPPNGELPAGTLCRIVQEAGSYVAVTTSLGATGYVALSAVAAT